VAPLTERSKHDDVAVLKLAHGTTNPLNRALVAKLSSDLEEISKDSTVRGLVLASASPKFFSLGLAVPELLGLPEDELTRFFHTFNDLSIELLTLRMPTIAAITGHAVAGGCVLALCCDYRFIADGRCLMGLNEIKLGVPVPLPGECALIAAAGESAARKIIDSGEFYEPADSLRMGLCDRILPEGEVLSAAVQHAALLGSRPPQTTRAVKEGRIAPMLARLRGESTARERSFLRCWQSAETQALLQEAAAKF
jgi:3,2-trans-enoyl-CoA isomerase